MKIIWFKGNLGNQIFGYALYLYLLKKTNGKKHNIYGYYYSNKPILLNKIFDLELPPSNFFVNLCAFLFRVVIKILSMYVEKIPFVSTDKYYFDNALFFDGYWQNKNFFEAFDYKWLNFKNTKLNKKNQDAKKMMLSTNSVSVHVRRGDYLKYSDIYVNLSVEYYKLAFDIVENKYKEINYFFFSDDIEWVKSNLNMPNSIYVDWNKNDDSYLDMYLMAHAKVNIISNSTFSYWSAYMNRHNDLVIYPKKWMIKDPDPQIFFEKWIGL